MIVWFFSLVSHGFWPEYFSMLEAPGFPRRLQQDVPGRPGTLKGWRCRWSMKSIHQWLNQCYWNPLESIGIHWNPLESIGIHWNPLESIGIHWNPLESIGIHWNPLESIGIHWNPRMLLMSTDAGWGRLRSEASSLMESSPASLKQWLACAKQLASWKWSCQTPKKKAAIWCLGNLECWTFMKIQIQYDTVWYNVLRYITIYFPFISHITCTFWILHETTRSRNGGLQGSATVVGYHKYCSGHSTRQKKRQPPAWQSSITSLECSEKVWTRLGVTPNNSSSSTNGDWNLQTCIEHVGLDKEWPRTLSTIMERATWLNPSHRRLSGSVAFKVVIHQIL